jgi:Tfp pilus assembly protein PilF
MRCFLAAAFLLLSAYFGLMSFSSGAARLFSQYSLSKSSLPAAEKAISYATSDPEAHYARAVVLLDGEQYEGAVKELETAVALRPEDYYLWLELGRAREDAGDSTGAESALRHSISLAPYYAQPHWQLGNLLLRSGEPDTSFAELRLAANINGKLFPTLTNLAWAFYQGDVQSAIKATQPQTNATTLELAEFLITRGKQNDGVELLRSVGSQSQSDVESLVARLLEKKDFVTAHQVWLLLQPLQTTGEMVIDGSFEQKELATGIGFSWRISPEPRNVLRLLEVGGAQSGNRCLHFQFSGTSNSAEDLISQYVVIEPGAKYRLRFAARGQGLVTAGLPLVALVDAANPAVVVAQSETVPRGSSGWEEYSVDFETSATLQAIRIVVRRQECTSKPCPVFGDAWFDSFVLEARKG